ncbi:MAG: hypothetical protein JWO67_3330 [Streptosporangiaceae bacterium]|nr:hypothetical protein [Streptosporangiaceae bacterium]
MNADLPPLVDMDSYAAIQIIERRADAPSRLLAETARRVADLWNDPPFTFWQAGEVRRVFPELADALDELLGGGPSGTVA